MKVDVANTVNFSQCKTTDGHFTEDVFVNEQLVKKK